MKLLHKVASTAIVVGSLFSGVSSAAIHTIDLLVLHPPKSVLNTDVLTRVASMEQYANKALENSEASIRFRVVKIEEINLPNARTDGSTLSALKNSKIAQELRAKYKADIVTMITPTGPYCGVGYVLRGTNDTLYSGQEKYGFNVVGDRCISSFAHEIGHNLGLSHSYKQGSNGGLYSWGRGHGVQSNFVTTMAYTSAYQARRVQFFSNPDITKCNGLSCGKPINQTDGAHAVRAVNVSGPQIAKWFDSGAVIGTNNVAPRATDDNAVTRTDEAVEINVLNNDVDPDQDTLVIESVATAKHGTTTVSADVVLYTPDAGFVGQDNFEYTINDGNKHSVTAKVTVNVGWGVNFEYFQGSWSKLPDFANATAVKQGISHNFSLASRLRDNDFGFRYFGQIEIPNTGDYQFFLTSDDGSKLFIDGQEVINNDGLHGAITKNSLINLTAGLHRIEVHFFERTGGQRLDVEWQGPNLTRQIISSKSLRLASPANSFPVAVDDTAKAEQSTAIIIDVLKNDIDTDGDAIQLVSFGSADHGTVKLQANKLVYQANVGYTGVDQFSYIISDGRGGEDTGLVTVNVTAGNGLAVEYEYYEGNWNVLPDFDSLTPAASGTQKDFSLINRNKDDYFAFRFHSGLDIPKDGRYYMFVYSDDGSKIFIDGKLVINNDGARRSRFWKRARLELTAGVHEIEVQYLEKTGRERLIIYLWERSMRFKKINEKLLKPF